VIVAATGSVHVVHNVAASRFEAEVGGHLCVAAYDLDDGVLRMTHTAVPRALEGRGIAAALVSAALAHARSEGFKVAPVCSYVRSYVRRHAETRDLLADGYGV